MKFQNAGKVQDYPVFDVVSVPSNDVVKDGSLLLQDDLVMLPYTSWWHGQTGAWLAGSLDCASWKLSYGNLSWAMDFYNSLWQQTFRAELVTDEALISRFGWMPLPTPANISIKKKYQETLAVLTMSSHLQQINASISNINGNVSAAMLNLAVVPQTEPEWNVLLTDANGQLVYVVILWEVSGLLKYQTSVGLIDIYDSAGNLVAYSVRHPDFDRYLLLEPASGYLLATAESPGIGLNISLSEVPEDAFKGYVRTFGMHFERGGYTNASELLNPDLRWVLAASVQARALRDAFQTSSRWQPVFMSWLVSFGPLCVALLGFLAALCMSRVVWHWAYNEEQKAAVRW